MVEDVRVKIARAKAELERLNEEALLFIHDLDKQFTGSPYPLFVRKYNAERQVVIENDFAIVPSPEKKKERDRYVC